MMHIIKRSQQNPFARKSFHFNSPALKPLHTVYIETVSVTFHEAVKPITYGIYGS